jgi:hypothetical protein
VADVPDGYRYEQRWDEAQIMTKVATTYRKHLVYVSNLIHSKAASAAVQEFANAFKFTNKE